MDRTKTQTTNTAGTERTTEAKPASDTREADTTCPECDSQTHHSGREVVCCECGLVVDRDEIDRGPERSVQKGVDGRGGGGRAVGQQVTNLLHDKGLTTEIDWKDRDIYGNALSSRQRQRMGRLRKWHKRAKAGNSDERYLKQGLSEIQRMAAALGVPQTARKDAGNIFRQIQEADILRGRSVEGCATAALYAAARRAECPRTLDEFETVSRVERTKINRTYLSTQSELEIKVPPADPKTYADRLVSELDAPDTLRREATEIINQASHTILSGRAPMAIAAAAVYAAARISHLTVTQADVSDVADVSCVTIRNHYPDLLEEAGHTPPT